MKNKTISEEIRKKNKTTREKVELTEIQKLVRKDIRQDLDKKKRE